jgi:hypothetical protein
MDFRDTGEFLTGELEQLISFGIRLLWEYVPGMVWLSQEKGEPKTAEAGEEPD